MKDWVRPFLIEKLKEALKDMEEGKEKEEWIKLKIENEIDDEDSARIELVDHINHNFGYGIGGYNWEFTEIFGSVLADLPEEVFKKIQGMKGVYFIFTPNPGAEVKTPVSDVRKGSQLRIVNFPYQSIFMPTMALRGEVVHELAHVYQEHAGGSSDKIEDKTDELAKSWGFEKEIKALREWEIREEESTMKIRNRECSKCGQKFVVGGIERFGEDYVPPQGLTLVVLSKYLDSELYCPLCGGQMK